MTVDLSYVVSFGDGDGSEKMEWQIELTEEEAEIYNHAIENKIPLCEVEELEEVLERAYEEIVEEETSNAILNGDEYALQCSGETEMDPDEINDLVAARDPHALEYFGISDLSDEELDEWDASDLDELPLIIDFDEDFDSYSPFDEGWSLEVVFVDPNE